MEFKVASFYRAIKKNANNFTDELYRYCYECNVHCIKIFKTANTKTKGVQLNDGTMDSATSFIINNDGKSLVELRFIIINEVAKKSFILVANLIYLIFGKNIFLLIMTYLSLMLMLRNSNPFLKFNLQ